VTCRQLVLPPRNRQQRRHADAKWQHSHRRLQPDDDQQRQLHADRNGQQSGDWPGGHAQLRRSTHGHRHVDADRSGKRPDRPVPAQRHRHDNQRRADRNRDRPRHTVFTPQHRFYELCSQRIGEPGRRQPEPVGIGHRSLRLAGAVEQHEQRRDRQRPRQRRLFAGRRAPDDRPGPRSPHRRRRVSRRTIPHRGPAGPVRPARAGSVARILFPRGDARVDAGRSQTDRTDSAG
jgi:hypothetical protein